MGGGAGGIIQIISPAGRLPPKALSLKRGTRYGVGCSEAEHGYYHVGGNFLWRTIKKCLPPACRSDGRAHVCRLIFAR